MKIIPAIDIIDGKCVRLSRGDYGTQKMYYKDPLDAAKLFESYGLRHLHLVDLDGSKASRIMNAKVLERIANFTSLQIDFGGGIKSHTDIQLAFNAGAKQVTVGSVAVQDEKLMLDWLQRYGAEKIILGADCRNRKIAVNGWLNSTNRDIALFLKDYVEKGVTCSIVSDIEKDGMLLGPFFGLYEELLSKTRVQLVASGGIRTIDDIQRLKEIGCAGVIIGKGFYEGTIDVKELGQLC